MGLGKLFGACTDLAVSAVRVVAAPAEVVLTAAHAVTKPIVDKVVDVCEDVNEELRS